MNQCDHNANFEALLTEMGRCAQETEGYIEGLLKSEQRRGTPERLLDAMRHAALGGGKRFRPFLVIQSALLCGVERSVALPAASAIELVHCYSLVHDDLPVMDNDPVRRGRPSVWKAFDEWTAVLVGDALLTLAFECLADDEYARSHGQSAMLVRTLARAAGANGMVGGQALDLQAERLTDGAPPMTPESVRQLHGMKTGRLISAACEMGACIGDADERILSALRRYGDDIGLAFQLSDDLLDAEGETAIVGKTTGKDEAAGKATYVSLLGVEATRQRLNSAISNSVAALEPFGPVADHLIAAAHYLAVRQH